MICIFEFILFLHTYIYICFQLVTFVREHVWHKASLMEYLMRLELTLVFAQSAGAVEYTDCFSAEG